MLWQSLAPTNTPGNVPNQIGNTRLQSTVPKLKCPSEVKNNGSPTKVRINHSDVRAYQMAPMWLSNFLEKDKVLRTRARDTLS